MKKLFFLAAAMCAAVSLNAVTYDFATLANESDWIIKDATKSTSSTETKLVYDIAANVPAEITSTLSSDIMFTIKNGSDKKSAFNINLGKCFEFGGKNGIIVLSNVQVGAFIKLEVAAKGGTAANFVDKNGTYPKGAVAISEDLVLPAKNAGAEGADEEGYIWKTIVYQAVTSTVEIKEFDGGFRIKALSIDTTSGLSDINAEQVKATKMMVDGQMLIVRDGVKYNALGTVVE